MTEAEWFTCDEVTPFLELLKGISSARKCRLFAVACCWRVPQLLADPRSREAVEVAERYADGRATKQELGHAADRAEEVGNPREDNFWTGAWAAHGHAHEAAQMVSWNASVDRTDAVENAAHVAILRDIFGNPFRRVTFSPMWRTDTVVALAAQMYETRDFSTMPILADALQDTGCDNDDILNHCRGPGPHVRGCFVVDLVLDKT